LVTTLPTGVGRIYELILAALSSTNIAGQRLEPSIKPSKL